MKARKLFCASALALAVASLSAISNTAHAQAATLQIKALAANCANCHGTNGVAVPGSSVPGLAGTSAPAMIAAMAAFKAGTRPATIMHQLAKGYTDEQIAQMAAYFAAQKP
jgi:cytochrome subunit of sulfide dehydrogenase